MAYIPEEQDLAARVTSLPPARSDVSGIGSGLLVVAVFIVVAIMASVILNTNWSNW